MYIPFSLVVASRIIGNSKIIIIDYLGVSKHKQQRSKKLKRLSLLSSTPVVCSRCTRILSPVPHESSTSSEDSTAQLATVEEIQKYSSEMQVSEIKRVESIHDCITMY